MNEASSFKAKLIKNAMDCLARFSIQSGKVYEKSGPSF